MKGKSKEDRVNNWYNYFKELLGKQPKITNENEPIISILNEAEVDIKTDHSATLSAKMLESE